MTYWVAYCKDGKYRVFIQDSAVMRAKNWDYILDFLSGQRNVKIQTANIFEASKLRDLERIATESEKKDDSD